MHCAVAVAAVAAAINNKKSLPKRHTEPFSDGFSSHLWSPIQCISTISFFLSFSIWIYSIHKMNANKSVKYKQTNKQIDLAVKYVICSFLNEMKWNELERMRVVQMLNERRNCKWRALEFFRMILEQLKTSGGDSFVLQSIHCVCVCVGFGRSCYQWSHLLNYQNFLSPWNCRVMCCLLFTINPIRVCLVVVFFSLAPFYSSVYCECNVELNRHISYIPFLYRYSLMFLFSSSLNFAYSFRIHYSVNAQEDIFGLVEWLEWVQTYYAHKCAQTYILQTTSITTRPNQAKQGNARHGTARQTQFSLHYWWFIEGEVIHINFITYVFPFFYGSHIYET